MIGYSQVSTEDHGIPLDIHDLKEMMSSTPNEESKEFDSTLHAISNDTPFPISRPPVNNRDWIYGLIFITHFIIILLLSLVEKVSLHNSTIDYARAGSWSSMVMIVTITGVFLGVVFFYLLMATDQRIDILRFSLTFSLILKIIMGNILFIMRSKFSFIGLLIICSALWDAFRYPSAKSNINFTSTLIEIIGNLTKAYGIRLAIGCAMIVALQSCILIWWGAFYIGLISSISTSYVILLSIIMFLSLFWIVQVFHLFISYVIGGCILWLFLRETDSSSTNAIGSPDSTLKSKLYLYLQCGITTSFGSLCKAALFMIPSQIILHYKYSIFTRQFPFLSRFCLPCLQAFDSLCNGLLEYAKKYHKLSICLLAVYGRTLIRTAEDHLMNYPETLNSSMEDMSSFILSCTASSIAGVLAIIFALCAEGREMDTWPLFFLVCYSLAFSGLSLILHIYSSAVDALIVAASLNPTMFANINQLVLFRFIRTSELEMR